jgi:hypothetical protein
LADQFALACGPPVNQADVFPVIPTEIRQALAERRKPVQQPIKFELIINLRTKLKSSNWYRGAARSIGITKERSLDKL